MSQKKLTKRDDGRYKVNYGKKQFYGKTKAEALRKRDAYVEMEKNEPNESKEDSVGLTFCEYGLNWLNVYRAECNHAQRKQYATMIKYTSSALRDKPIQLITVTDMQCVCNSLGKFSSSYISKYLSVIRGIFKTAVAEGILQRNPMALVKRPKCKETIGHRALEPWERELITETYAQHDFGLCAMVMLYAGLRRGEALYLDVDRDVDFEKQTITVRGAVSFLDGNQPQTTSGKTKAAQRTIPLVPPLAAALQGHHGLLCSKLDGTLMSQSAFNRKFDSYKTFLESKLNGCYKGWYGKTKEHKLLLAEGKPLPPWRSITIRCHDFRVDFCTRCYYAGIPLKTLQNWMGHNDTQMILDIYSKLTKEQEVNDATKLTNFIMYNS